jgi:GAF domain-containing protein/HAMP domain-containing protein
LIEDMKAGGSGFITVHSDTTGEVYVAYAPLETTGWSLASVVPTDIVLAEVHKLESEMSAATQWLIVARLLPLTLVLLGVLVFLGLLVTSLLTNPLARLAEAADQLGAGQWDVELPAAQVNELGVLASSFGKMRDQLRGLVNELEQRVLERTSELEKRSRQVQAASEIARDISTAPSLDEMLASAIDLIVTRFGFYSGSIFLTDELGEFAQQAAVAGHMSEIFRQRRLKLRVGQEGIVGYVAAQGRARIASDVSQDENYYYDPLLAGTRSEMALPLMVGENVIGVLDLQHSTAGAFSQEDVVVLQTMADQLAVAIENQRLVQRLETAVQESGLAYQRQLEQGWRDAARGLEAPAFVYDGLQVRSLVSGMPADLQADLHAGKTVTVVKERAGDQFSVIATPIMLRGQAIGALVLEHQDPHHAWTSDEVTILESTANQAALTLENARLLTESQRRAEREQMLSQMTARIRETLDIHTVMRTAVEEVQRSLLLPELTIHLGTLDPTLAASPGNGRGGNGTARSTPGSRGQDEPAS